MRVVRMLTVLLFCVPFVHAASVSINHVQNYTSFRSNVTTELWPLNHITMNHSAQVLYLPFDVPHNEDNFTFDYRLNRSVQVNNTLNYDTYNTSGYIGGAYTFNGSNFLDVGNVPIFRPIRNITISVWVYARNNSNAGGASSNLLAHDGGSTEAYFIQWKDSGTASAFGVTCGFKNHSTVTHPVSQGFAPLTDGWHHVTCMRDGTNGNNSIFFDGIYRNSTTYVNPGNITYTGNTRLLIGTGAPGAGSFRGTLDEIMIFNRTLTNEEISDIYNTTFARFAGPPAVQRFQNVSIEQDGTINRLNVTTNATLLNNSAMNITVMEYNITGSNYQNTTPQAASDGDNQVLTFTIGTATENVSTLVTFINNDYNSYSPVLRDALQLDSYAISSGDPVLVHGSVTTQVFCGANTVQQYGPNTVVMIG